jgi:hypothetical protein
VAPPKGCGNGSRRIFKWRAKVNPYFCAFGLPENRGQSPTIFSSKSYEKTEYEKANGERTRGNERNGELKTGNSHRLKAASVSADTGSTSTGRKDG